MNFVRTFVAMTAAVAVTAGLALADAPATSGASAPPAAATPATLTIPMKALNGSKEDGTATLTEVSSGVNVTVTLKNAPTDPQPTHIHIGTCGNINKAPEYALQSTIAGASTTTVKGVSLAQLLAGKYAINVHKSADDLATYVSCGNITRK